MKTECIIKAKRAALLVTPVIIVGVLLYNLKRWNDYDLRTYVAYNEYKPRNGISSLIRVATNDYIDAPVQHERFMIIRGKGKAYAVKNVMPQGTTTMYWSKDETILAFMDTVYLEKTGKRPHSTEIERSESYYYAYDFLDDREINPNTSRKIRSSIIKEILSRRKGVGRIAKPTEGVIGMDEQDFYRKLSPY
jgi:hypothetical protein